MREHLGLCVVCVSVCYVLCVCVSVVAITAHK